MKRGRGWGESTYTYLLGVKNEREFCLGANPDRGSRWKAIGPGILAMD